MSAHAAAKATDAELKAAWSAARESTSGARRLMSVAKCERCGGNVLVHGSAAEHIERYRHAHRSCMET